MTQNVPQNIIDELLGDAATKKILEETGLAESRPEIQMEFIGMLGSNILKRLALEILSAIPKSDHAAFESLVGSGDMKAMREFLEPRIANVDKFMVHYATLEYEETKNGIVQLGQEVI
jgi:hypothetical protein